MKCENAWSRRFACLDKHNARTARENVRLERGLRLRHDWHEWLWEASVWAQRLLSPFVRLNIRIHRWQHGQAMKKREKTNGPW